MPAAGRSPEPLRATFVVDSQSWGGAETWVLHHVRRAAAGSVRASVVATAAVADRFRAELPAERVQAVPLARFESSAPAVAAALARQRADVVHVNLVDPGSNAAVLRAALDHAPTVATLHLPGDMESFPGTRVLADLYSRLELLTTPSREAADQVRNALGEPRSGVAVTQNGVDVPPDPHGPARVHPPVVGVHCRLTRQKGVDTLISACRILHARGLEFETLIAGAGREDATLRAAARGLPIRFVGWADDSRQFLRRLSVFCLPSRQEAMPLALLEALAEGLPCVATDVGDVGRVLGSVLELVPADDATALAAGLATVLTDQRRADSLAHAGRLLAERQLDADAMAATTYRLVREAIARTAVR